LKIEEPHSFQKAIDSPNYKEWMDARRNKWTLWREIRFGILLIFVPDVD